MARIGIITFLHNENCGSSLQAWALQRALLGMGHRPLGLDYRPDRREQILNLLRSGNSPAVVLDSMRRRKGRGERNTAGFDAFRRERLTLSAPCANQKALRAAARDCEILLCGSDQIWSPEWLNPAYFLTFGEKQPRVAYAASLGVSRLPNGTKQRKMRRWAAPFRAVSVREEEGREILRQLLPEREIAVMPDPVLLLTREEWLELAGNPPAEQKLVCYFLKDRPEHWARAEQLARERGLRLRPLGVTAEGRARLESVPNPDPVQWLTELAGAAAVITDSFHGAAMAAILGKPLTICRRWADGDPASKNSRLDQLRRLAGWEKDEDCLPGPEVERRLEQERQRGLRWLRESLG